MVGGFAPRFMIEAGFLILLGIGSGLADLRNAVIVGVLGGGWLLVSLIELTVWRAPPRPVGPFVPPPRPEPEPRPAYVQEETADAGLESGSDSPSPEGIAYPLRADAGAQPSDEIEAYTRVLGGQPESSAPDERADDPIAAG